jgi:hypothetical protein
MLAGCGGSDGTPTPPPPPAPTPVTLAGKVIGDQGIKGATVCLDVNANKLCDTGEPVSAVTGSDGAYSIATDSDKAPAATLASASLIALIPTAAVDAADPGSTVTTRAFVMSTSAGKTGQINPLTTLVQAGVANSLKLADSEAAVAVQLGIPAAHIYDYQALPAIGVPFPDNARMHAQIVKGALEEGVALSVVGIASTDNGTSQLASLVYTDAANYSIRIFEPAEEKGTGKTRLLDKRSGLTAGAPTSSNALYGQVWLTPTGWSRCDSNGFHSTRGSPSRSGYCNDGQTTAGFTVETDISGKSMGEVIRSMQASAESNTVTMNPVIVDNVTFPSGSKLRNRTNATLGQNLWINNVNSTSEALTGVNNANVDAFINARRTSNVNLVSNAGLTWVGFTGDLNHWLAVSFIDATRVQYYSCTFNAQTNAFVFCVTLNEGTYQVVPQNGVKLIKFAGQPNPVESINFTVGYGEYNGGMARFRELKAEERYLVTYSNRLNQTAGEALRKALGI